MTRGTWFVTNGHEAAATTIGKKIEKVRAISMLSKSSTKLIFHNLRYHHEPQLPDIFQFPDKTAGRVHEYWYRLALGVAINAR